MTVAPTPFGALAFPARVLIVGVIAAAAALATALTRVDGTATALAILAVAACIATAEGFRLSLPYRGGGVVRFTLVDAAITGALVLASPTELVAGTAIGMLVWQAIDRLPVYKLLYNQAQQVLGVGTAALVMRFLADGAQLLEPHMLLGLCLALCAFLAVNTVAVSLIIALSSEPTWMQATRRMLPTNAIMMLCNGCLGLLTVVIADQHPYALPALAGPLLLVYSSSRQRVSAQLQRERSHEIVNVEHQLSEATDATQIAQVIVAGLSAVLGYTGSVWREGSWITPVPAGSGPCPVSADLRRTLSAPGAVLGPATDATCAAIGLGGGVLVAWSTDACIDVDTSAWLERLARSARVHFDRAAVLSSLERERATLRAVVDGSSDGIYVLDSSGVVALCNPAMARLAGVPIDRIVGAKLPAILGDGPWEVDGRHEVDRPTDGGENPDRRIWSVSVSSVWDQSLSDLQIGVVHDVSAERRVSRMKEDMLAIVSHELRTPLTPIKASAQVLARRWDRLEDEQRTQLLEQIEERADHLARLVNDMLLVAQLSRDTDTALVVQAGAADVATLTRQEVEELARARPHHRLVYEGPASLRGWTDPARLRQILDNLIENACKFSLPDSVVTVTLRAEGGDAVLSVADQGRGIPPEDLERIFERFERVEDPLHMRTSGTGLGLYIVRSLVEALHGSVSVDSMLGVGTTVEMRMPLGDPQQRRPEASASAA